MIHDEAFWKEVYRDVLREVVRAEGFDALRATANIRRVCQTLATESDLALQEARAAAPKCATCKGLQWVFDLDAAGVEIQPGRRCPECNTKTEPPPAGLAASTGAHGL